MAVCNAGSCNAIKIYYFSVPKADTDRVRKVVVMFRNKQYELTMQNYSSPRSLLVAALMVAGYGGILHASAQSAAPQPTFTTDSWGESVNGIQLRVARSTRISPQVPGWLPPLEMQIRNLGEETFTFRNKSFLCGPGLEIDGAWYLPMMCVGNGDGYKIELIPGAKPTSLYVGFDFLGLLDGDGKIVLREKFDLKPGKHSLRVRTPDAFSDIQDPTQKPVTLVSNMITIDVPEDGSGLQGDPVQKGGGFFVAPISGTLYIKCVGGDAGAVSQFGIGTSPSTFVSYLNSLPRLLAANGW